MASDWGQRLQWLNLNKIQVTSCQHDVDANVLTFFGLNNNKKQLVKCELSIQTSYTNKKMNIKSLFWDSEMHQVYFKKHNPTFRYANDLLQKICTNKYIIGCRFHGHIQRCASPVRDCEWMVVDLSGSLGFRRVCSFSIKSLQTRMQTVIWTRTDWPFRSPGRYRLHVWSRTNLYKCNCAVMESNGGISVWARRTMTYWRHFTFTTHEHVRETGASCHNFYSSVFSISQWIQTLKSLLQKSYEHVHHSCLIQFIKWIKWGMLSQWEHSSDLGGGGL